MKNESDNIIDSELLAYVDEQLDAKRAAEIEVALLTHPKDAEKAELWRKQNEVIRELYSHVGDEPLPDRLDVWRIEAEVTRKKRDWHRLAAAAIVCLFIGSGIGWLGHSFSPLAQIMEPQFVADAVDAHTLYASDVAHPVEFSADRKTELATWISRRLDREIAVPDLSDKGYSFVGGRLLPAGIEPAALYMYEDKNGQRVTLYIVPRPHGQETALRFVGYDNLEALYWHAEDINCVLVGELPRDELKTMALEIYKQIG